MRVSMKTQHDLLLLFCFAYKARSNNIRNRVLTYGSCNDCFRARYKRTIEGNAGDQVKSIV
jgi:hypothetical protein